MQRKKMEYKQFHSRDNSLQSEIEEGDWYGGWAEGQREGGMRTEKQSRKSRLWGTHNVRGGGYISLSSSLDAFHSSSELLACLFSTTRLLWPNLGSGFENPIHSPSVPKPSLALAMAHCAHHWFHFARIFVCMCANRTKRKSKKKITVLAWGSFKETPALFPWCSQVFKNVGSVFNHHSLTWTTMTRITLAIH